MFFSVLTFFTYLSHFIYVAFFVFFSLLFFDLLCHMRIRILEPAKHYRRKTAATSNQPANNKNNLPSSVRECVSVCAFVDRWIECVILFAAYAFLAT